MREFKNRLRKLEANGGSLDLLMEKCLRTHDDESLGLLLRSLTDSELDALMRKLDASIERESGATCSSSRKPNLF